MKNFEYFEPSSIEDACALLRKYGKKAKIIAGGTDILVKMKNKTVNPQYLININKIQNLNKIKNESNGLHIGSLVTLSDITKSSIVNEYYPILAETSGSIGGEAIRNLGTIGGNLCNASPASDGSVALMALDAVMEIKGNNQNRSIEIKDFFIGPGTHTLKEDEILTGIFIKKPLENSKGIFIKLGIKKAMQIGIVTVALMVAFKSNSIRVKDVRIALGSVAPTPIRVFCAEDILSGKELDENLISKASEASVSEISPIIDIRSTVEYRTEMVKVLIRRALNTIKNNL